MRFTATRKGDQYLIGTLNTVHCKQGNRKTGNAYRIERQCHAYRSRSASHQTCLCSGVDRHRSGCSRYSHRFHTQTHPRCYKSCSPLREREIIFTLYGTTNRKLKEYRTGLYLDTSFPFSLSPTQVLSPSSLRSPRQLQLTRPSDVSRHRSWQPPLLVRHGENSPIDIDKHKLKMTFGAGQFIKNQLLQIINTFYYCVLLYQCKVTFYNKVSFVIIN